MLNRIQLKWCTKLILFISLSLFFCSSAFAFGIKNAETESVMQYALDQATSDYERAIILEAFERRFPTIESDRALYLNAEELSRFENYATGLCGTPFNLEFFRIISSFNDYWLMDKVREQLFSKPAHLTKVKSDADFEVWYTDDSATYPSDAVTEASAAKVLDYMAKSKTTEIDTWGYKKGGTEDAANPGTQAAKYQVYIHDLGGAYGSTTDFVTNPPGSETVPQTWSAIGIAPSVTPDDLLLDTSAHEYHHASQLAYMDITGFKLWILEATTTWIAYQVRQQYSAVTGTGSWNLFKSRVEWHQDRPNTPLDQTGSTVTDDYDAGLYLWFLANNKVISGADRGLILKFWQKMGQENDWEKIFGSFDHALSGLGDKYDTFDEIFPYYVAANYGVAEWYPKLIKTVKIENNTTPHTLDYNTSDSHILTEQTTGKVNHLASRYYKFVPGPTLESPVQLTIKVNGPDGKDVSAIVIAKKKDGTFVEYPFTLGALDKNGEVGISGFCTKEITEVVLVLVNYSKSTDDLEFKYEAFLCKGVVFCIDDTGSMGGEIAYAKAAAIKVLDDNKAAGNVRYYTLLTFKDGAATLRGQSSDEDTMKGYINALYASGGPGCPESSLTAIRQGADLSKGSDILMMTDASSNSYGVDNTYAEWGEVFATIFKLLENKCHLHSIVYSTCYHSYSSGDGDDEWQCPECYYDGLDIFSLGSEDPSGEDGYNRASTETGGLYFRISSSDTEKAAEIILREASSDSTICFYDGSLSGGDTSYTVPVDDTITQLQVVLNGNVGSSLSLEVKNPAGEIVDNDTAGVSVISVSGSTFYLIEETALASGASFWSAGDWTAKVSGNGSYRFSASCSTANPMDYTGDTSVGVGGALSLKASIRMAVTGIGFQLVELDGSGPMDVTLTSSDGLSYIGTHIMDTVGSYRFRATGDGNYQRMYSSKITVGNLDVVAPAAKNVAPGTSLTHQFQVKNLGTEEDTYDLFATSSLGWSDLTGIAASITIAAGGTENIDIPVTVPADATTGQVDVLSVQAVSQANSLINDTDDTETRVGTIYDFDGNGVVDVVDIMKVASRWNTKAGDADYDATYDLDGDGDIDIIDIMMVAAQWGWTT